MSYPDPFDNTSPWGESNSAPADHSTPNASEAPVTTPASTTPTSAPFKIGFTLKAAAGYDAEWLTPTVWGYSAEETAKRGAELLTAMKNEGLIDLTAKAADYTRGLYKGGGGAGSAAPKRFENGRVTSKSAPAAGPGDDDCPHGRKLVDKGSWSAMFCQAQNKGDQCEPLWKQKDGSFKAK
ncbi:hypothetical protein ACIRVF_11140 [Kitasatospora sp. NPDC101157]|uniref:hypothetical protein n=1 Tax=Kitasatospora sp. NPDC101157 TaxID=3364098 RepID=UPI00380288D0